MAGLDQDTIQAALIGYQAELTRIEAKMAELRAQARGSSAAAPVAVRRAGRRGKRRGGMSEEGRRRIAEAQRQRWAALKAGKKKGAAKPKRKLSAAGRAAISRAAKARWAAIRKAKGKSAGAGGE